MNNSSLSFKPGDLISYIRYGDGRDGSDGRLKNRLFLIVRISRGDLVAPGTYFHADLLDDTGNIVGRTVFYDYWKLEDVDAL